MVMYRHGGFVSVLTKHHESDEIIIFIETLILIIFLISSYNIRLLLSAIFPSCFRTKMFMIFINTLLANHTSFISYYFILSSFIVLSKGYKL